jgi:hypothetical protein
MKSYTTKPNDSFANIAEKFQIKDEFYLKTFHNLNCSNEEVIHGKIPTGTQILIPEDPEYLIEDSTPEEDNTNEDEVDSMNGYDDETEEQTVEENPSQEKKQEAEEEKQEEQKESGSSSHDGKYFVIQKGMAMCDKGAKFPNFKVTSHQKHYWNNEEGKDDYLAVTEDDLLFNPPAMPFGTCSIKNGNPCAYAPSGKWTKTYDKVKVMGKSCVTEISELKCSTGGKITIFKHGQQSEIGKSNLDKADSQEQHMYNPLVDFEEFKEEMDDCNTQAW